MIVVTLTAVALLAALFAPRIVRPERMSAQLERVERGLRRFGGVVLAILAVLVVWWVWGQLLPVAKIHDEGSYLLQAEIFARGRWTAPSPPIPEFFEQPHVQVVPAVASKYPPGHALLLTLGVLVGFPAFVPLLLTGLTTALLFALVTRVSNPWVGLLASTFWISAPIVLRFQPSYLSELTTTPLILASWWALLEWRASRTGRWLVWMALAVGWGAITRPLTMLAIAAPIGLVVARDIVRLRRWRDAGLALASAVAVLSIVPLWNARTTGNWRLSPLELYRRDYLPFDKLGFTVDTSVPRRAGSMSPVLVTLYADFLTLHKEQPVEALPQVASHRAVNLAVGFFQGARLPLLPFAIAGLFLSGALQFAAVSALLLFLVHLPYAHWAAWTLYYLEITPVVAALVALGLWRTAVRVSGREHGAELSILLVTIVAAGFALPEIERWRREHRHMSAFARDLAVAVKRLPSQPAILFVRYSPRLRRHVSAIQNLADLERAPVWVVHDLGERNAELQRRAPNRTPYHLDEDRIVSRPRDR